MFPVQTAQVKEEFNLAVELLHSFEYDEAEKVFAKIIDKEPDCAMAYWGVAMCNYHPALAPAHHSPNLKKELKLLRLHSLLHKNQKGNQIILMPLHCFIRTGIRQIITPAALNFEKAMEKMYTEYPDDKEAAIFYALSLDAAADPADKSFANQKKAGAF